MPTSRPLPTVVGPTENALRALLLRTLATSPIDGYPAWVVLNALSAAGADEPDAWRSTTASALAVDDAALDRVVDHLRATGLVDGTGALTDAGATELAAARTAVAAATSRLVDGISDSDQETTRRVLDRMRREAGRLLDAPAV